MTLGSSLLLDDNFEKMTYDRWLEIPIISSLLLWLLTWLKLQLRQRLE